LFSPNLLLIFILFLLTSKKVTCRSWHRYWRTGQIILHPKELYIHHAAGLKHFTEVFTYRPRDRVGNQMYRGTTQQPAQEKR